MERGQVDRWIEEYWAWIGGALFLLITLDLLLSLYAAAAVGIEHESNPVMAWLLVQPLSTIVAVHVGAAVLVAALFYGLGELITEAPEPRRRQLMRATELFVGLLLAAGLFVFANNLSVIVYGASLV